jgi:Protein of unknown function, DUF547.
MKKFSLLLFSLLLITSTIIGSASGQSTDTENPYLSALPLWANTLAKFVDEKGRTDFEALVTDSMELRGFLKVIAEISPTSNPELFKSQQEIYAYHINAYNALAMWGVIERDIPDNFSSLLKRASFFKFRSVIIGGKKTNLYDYENKVIRPLGEPRMHFVLNCMVKDCPRLPQTVFTAENLERDLQSAAIEFFNKDKHILIRNESEEVHLSGIMKFYTKDYVASGKKQDLIAYVNQYSKTTIPETYKVKFIKYDWTVNQQS